MATPANNLKRLGRYDIESVLGKGAMGVVYAGNDSRLQRKVAIKTILKSALDADTAKEYSMRFDREARAVARLNHPNIVQVYDFGEEDDIAYIVMEFIKGRELKDFFDAKERFEPKEVVHIMGELCEALHFAHEAGIIHRDIKPANVMIDSQGRVKLADFGVARITDADRGTSEKTQAGAIIGTPAYMSPEQIEGADIDRRTDIFSAGIILYQFLTGEKPFTGEGTWTIAKKILQDEPARPSSINKTISPAFDAVVNKALAKSVKDRFQTAQELGIALKRALEGKAPEDEEKTVVGFAPSDDATLIGAPPLPAGGRPAAKLAGAAADSTGGRAAQATAAQEMDLEFWRAIKDGDDPNDFELYVEQFPNGIYTALAKRKMAKLRGQASEDSTTRAAQAAEAEKRDIEEAARREAEAKAKLAEEKAKLEAELAKREAEFQQRAAEAEAKRQQEEQERAEAEAKAKAEFEAKLAQREREMQEREALAKHREEEATRIQKEVAKKKRGPIVTIAIAVIVAIVFIVYIALKPVPTLTPEELAKMLDQAKQANAQLLAAKEREQEMMRELDRARQMEAEAKAAGDVEKQRQMAEVARQREAELQKQAELVKKREAEAQKQAELVKKQQEQLEGLKAKQEAELAKKKAAGEKAAIEEKRAAEKVAAEKVAAEKAAAEKAAAEQRAAADRAAQKAAAEQRAAAERAAAERAAAEKAAAEKAAAEKAAAEKLAAEKAAAEKAAAEKAAAAQKLAVEKGIGAVAAAAKAVEKAAKQAAAGEKVATLDVAAALLKKGESAESSGDVRAAVKFYRDAARNGSGQAAKLLGDIYSNGKGDVGRDYQESLRWYAIAERAGVKVERARAR
ncbi:MAG: hypothetical protein A3I01_18045 [Betaproteobacteria bacterium RIFCSPLOWO2_02_FULL_65_24]|nr:MAG: hypothetical protein A3I01_18045 [Betaproteobacteria bacterium RIFCSPLOWO2_02_FULL_65_24]